MKILRADPGHPIRKRLWQAAGAVALVLAVVIAHETVARLAEGPHEMELGSDYLPVYAAGTLVREGRAAELYDLEPMARIERQVVYEADLKPLRMYGPFFNPPFFAALYAPLSALPYRTSLAVWLGINLLLLAGSVALLVRMIPAEAGWKSRALVPALIVLPLPFWEAMRYQQNTPLSLLLVCGVVTLWRRGESRAVLAGMVAGLLFYKPQLALMVAGALVLTRGWRAVLGLCLSGAGLLSFTLIGLHGTLGAFLRRMPPTVHWMQTALPYNWALQVTPQSFWRLLLQGHGIGPTDRLPSTLALLTSAGFAAALVASSVRYFRRGRCPADLDRLIAATVASMPLLMPYYMDYDLMLLAVPAVLLSAEWSRRQSPLSGADRLLLWAWAALFVEFYANPGLGTHSRFNLAVPLIGALASLLVARCGRVRDVAVEEPEEYDARRVAVAA